MFDRRKRAENPRPFPFLLEYRLRGSCTDDGSFEPKMISQTEEDKLALLQHLCLLNSRIPSLENHADVKSHRATV